MPRAHRAKERPAYSSNLPAAIPQLHRNTMDIFTTGKKPLSVRPRKNLRSSCEVSLGRDCLKHPQLPWLTSTLQRDAESATKFCPGGSPGVSSASSPLRRRPGEEKHSLPPGTGASQRPTYTKMSCSPHHEPPSDKGRRVISPLKRPESYGRSISPLISSNRASSEIQKRWLSDQQAHRSIIHRTEKFNSQRPPARKAAGYPGVRNGGLASSFVSGSAKASSPGRWGRLGGFKAGSEGREQEGGSNLLLLLLLLLF